MTKPDPLLQRLGLTLHDMTMLQLKGVMTKHPQPPNPWNPVKEPKRKKKK